MNRYASKTTINMWHWFRFKPTHIRLNLLQAVPARWCSSLSPMLCFQQTVVLLLCSNDVKQKLYKLFFSPSIVPAAAHGKHETFFPSCFDTRQSENKAFILNLDVNEENIMWKRMQSIHEMGNSRNTRMRARPRFIFTNYSRWDNSRQRF